MDDHAALMAKLESLKGPALQKAERKALGKVGDLVKGAAKRRAPSQAGEHAGGRLKPGELAASIKARVHIATDEGALGGDVSNVVISPVGRGVVGIASAVENGHVMVAGGKKGKGGRVVGHVPAYPFMRPAADETEAEAITTYAETMSEEIAEAME